MRKLPTDQGGSVLLLTGIMAFVVAIMTLFALDTSEAVYNRVVAQNSVDAAAETGALWQARGLNSLQSLNNAHYSFNVGIYIAEWDALGMCGVSVGNVASDYSNCPPWDPFCPECCPDSISNTYNSCTACSQAGPLNDLHDNVASGILGLQNFITIENPLAASIYASDAAHASGADDLNTVLSQYPGGALLGIAAFAMPYAPYASTIFPTSTSLNNQQVKGDNWPWKWNQFGVPESLRKTAAEIAWDAGKYACEFDIWQFGAFDGAFHDPSEWGWDDSYYQGVPGNMVWVAGKVRHDELAGLGLLRWMNSTSTAAQIQTWVTASYTDMTTFKDLPVYHGSALGNSALTIPAFLAVAGSQAESQSGHIKSWGKIPPVSPSKRRA